jgi:OTU domain-containing protein 5
MAQAAREAAFEQLMQRRGFALQHIEPDGNCLFRAISWHLYGGGEMHLHVRQLCVEFMRKERAYFERFVTEDFDAYLERKARPGVHGNHVEIHALCEMYCRPVLIYSYSDTPINSFQPESATPIDAPQPEGAGGGAAGGGAPAGPSASAQASQLAPIHLSYHNGSHYNALIDLDAPAVGVGLGLAAYEPAAEREQQLKAAAASSEATALEETVVREATLASEMDSIEAEMERAAMEVCARRAARGVRSVPQPAAALRCLPDASTPLSRVSNPLPVRTGVAAGARGRAGRWP